MKKILFSVAILAVAASCSKNEVVEAPQTNEISFSTLNDRVTRTATDDAEAGYTVYAVSSESSSAWYFVDAVDYLNQTSDVYYWPTATGATLSFYAYAPTGANLSNESISVCSAIGYTYTVPEDADEDFTLVQKTAQVYSADGAVALEFAHQLAKVTVEVKLAETFAASNTLGDTHTSAVTVYDSAAAVDVFAGTFAPTVTADKTGVATVKYEGALTYYIMPQAIDGCTLEIDAITVTTTSTGSTLFNEVDLAAITLSTTSTDAGYVGSTVTAFEAGKHYVFTITVDGSTETEDEEDALKVVAFDATNAYWTSGTDADASVDVDIDQTVSTSTEDDSDVREDHNY